MKSLIGLGELGGGIINAVFGDLCWSGRFGLNNQYLAVVRSQWTLDSTISISVKEIEMNSTRNTVKFD